MGDLVHSPHVHLKCRRHFFFPCGGVANESLIGSPHYWASLNALGVLCQERRWEGKSIVVPTFAAATVPLVQAAGALSPVAGASVDRAHILFTVPPPFSQSVSWVAAAAMGVPGAAQGLGIAMCGSSQMKLSWLPCAGCKGSLGRLHSPPWGRVRVFSAGP